jgi:MerR family transcriptional regulator/heat shock protein HspR
MTPPILPRELVARQLAVSPRLLLRYEQVGLVRVERAGDVEGYGPRELRRLWTVVSLHRDLGINLAGIEAVLRLHDHVAELHRRVQELADRLHRALEAERADADDEA